ncbi:MAG: LysM peptidoglycan-binding domain-containing protein [Nitrospirae bacterium]|jgi:peptidoglycan DL-endopeptidase LytE|nr:LysM peptidoglycan-binding domain-containing protein [Nitrospirota bacterium]
MKRIYFFIVSFIFLIIFFSNNTYADVTYVIKKGDNPTRIANKFNVKAADIIKLNNLNAHNLRPGTKIKIPSSNKIDSRNQTLTENQGNSNTAEQGDDFSFHIIKKGDTLSSLSMKYSISINELKELNNLKSSKIKIGQRIIVNKTNPKTYTVQKGDSIYKIAGRFNTGIDELREINGLETDLLKPGQKILLEPLLEQEKNKVALQNEKIEEEIKKVAGHEKDEELGFDEKLIILAKKLLNIPYRFGGNSLLGIDCSAFVQKVYGFVGINLPRSAREQFHEGNPVDKEELSIGDLVFFRTYATFPSHVGIYLGNNLFIHASSKKKKVTIDSLETPYFFKRFIGAKRVLDIEDKIELPGEG